MNNALVDFEAPASPARLAPPADDDRVAVCSAETIDSGSLPPDAIQPLDDLPEETFPRPLPGTPWMLERRLGSGGMCEVFLAYHVDTGEPAAIKMLNPHLAHDPRALERLQREALLITRIGHPNIVSVFGLDRSHNGRPFVVMEYLKGRDLKAVLREEGPLSPTRMVAICRQICAALQAAHERGVIHRDLKPENVMITQGPLGEHATLLDFGIARETQQHLSRLTLDHHTLGTPGYIAPEQARGDQVDARADVYGVAVIAFELLTNCNPYQTNSPIGTMMAQLTREPPSLREKCPDSDIPPALEAVIMRGMSREPGDRYPSARSFGRALLRALERPHGYRTPRALVAATLAAGVLAVGLSVLRGGLSPVVNPATASQSGAEAAELSLATEPVEARTPAPRMDLTAVFGAVRDAWRAATPAAPAVTPGERRLTSTSTSNDLVNTVMAPSHAERRASRDQEDEPPPVSAFSPSSAAEDAPPVEASSDAPYTPALVAPSEPPAFTPVEESTDALLLAEPGPLVSALPPPLRLPRLSFGGLQIDGTATTRFGDLERWSRAAIERCVQRVEVPPGASATVRFEVDPGGFLQQVRLEPGAQPLLGWCATDALDRAPRVATAPIRTRDVALELRVD